MDSLKAATIASIRKSILQAINDCPLGPFAWPDEPWSYEIHVGWVGDWNDEGRQTPCAEFLRNWIFKDENIEAALKRMEEFQGQEFILSGPSSQE
jgi:hypothetical protein